MPGSMPSAVPTKYGSARDPGDAGREADDAVRRDRQHTHDGDRDEAVPRDALAERSACAARECASTHAPETSIRSGAARAALASDPASAIGAPTIGPNTTIDVGDQEIDRKHDEPADDEAPSIASIASGESRQALMRSMNAGKIAPCEPSARRSTDADRDRQHVQRSIAAIRSQRRRAVRLRRLARCGRFVAGLAVIARGLELILRSAARASAKPSCASTAEVSGS